MCYIFKLGIDFQLNEKLYLTRVYQGNNVVINEYTYSKKTVGSIQDSNSTILNKHLTETLQDI